MQGNTTLLGDFSTANYENPEVFIIGSCEETSLVTSDTPLGVANNPHDTSYTFTVKPDADNGLRGDITIASNILASTYTETTAVKMFSDGSGNVCYLAQYASGTIEATGTDAVISVDLSKITYRPTEMMGTLVSNGSYTPNGKSTAFSHLLFKAENGTVAFISSADERDFLNKLISTNPVTESSFRVTASSVSAKNFQVGETTATAENATEILTFVEITDGNIVDGVAEKISVGAKDFLHVGATAADMTFSGKGTSAKPYEIELGAGARLAGGTAGAAKKFALADASFVRVRGGTVDFYGALEVAGGSTLFAEDTTLKFGTGSTVAGTLDFYGSAGESNTLDLGASATIAAGGKMLVHGDGSVTFNSTTQSTLAVAGTLEIASSPVSFLSAIDVTAGGVLKIDNGASATSLMRVSVGGSGAKATISGTTSFGGALEVSAGGALTFSGVAGTETTFGGAVSVAGSGARLTLGAEKAGETLTFKKSVSVGEYGSLWANGTATFEDAFGVAASGNAYFDSAHFAKAVSVAENGSLGLYADSTFAEGVSGDGELLIYGGATAALTTLGTDAAIGKLTLHGTESDGAATFAGASENTSTKVSNLSVGELVVSGAGVLKNYKNAAATRTRLEDGASLTATSTFENELVDLALGALDLGEVDVAGAASVTSPTDISLSARCGTSANPVALRLDASAGTLSVSGELHTSEAVSAKRLVVAGTFEFAGNTVSGDALVLNAGSAGDATVSCTAGTLTLGDVTLNAAGTILNAGRGTGIRTLTTNGNALRVETERLVFTTGYANAAVELVEGSVIKGQMVQHNGDGTVDLTKATLELSNVWSGSTLVARSGLSSTALGTLKTAGALRVYGVTVSGGTIEHAGDLAVSEEFDFQAKEDYYGKTSGALSVTGNFSAGRLKNLDAASRTGESVEIRVGETFTLSGAGDFYGTTVTAKAFRLVGAEADATAAAKFAAGTLALEGAAAKLAMKAGDFAENTNALALSGGARLELAAGTDAVSKNALAISIVLGEGFYADAAAIAGTAVETGEAAAAVTLASGAAVIFGADTTIELTAADESALGAASSVAYRIFDAETADTSALTTENFSLGSGMANWKVAGYDSATGTVTLTSTVPEPSAFGLLAGAFALA
ncbi:MAG: beta strand repeat-containing protein, partial [Candidatus Spyradosoma sp.]